jgi:hypothetical protein
MHIAMWKITAMTTPQINPHQNLPPPQQQQWCPSCSFGIASLLFEYLV